MREYLCAFLQLVTGGFLIMLVLVAFILAVSLPPIGAALFCLFVISGTLWWRWNRSRA